MNSKYKIFPTSFSRRAHTYAMRGVGYFLRGESDGADQNDKA